MKPRTAFLLFMGGLGAVVLGAISVSWAIASVGVFLIVGAVIIPGLTRRGLPEPMFDPVPEIRPFWCESCEYDMRGLTTDICPECGCPYHASVR